MKRSFTELVYKVVKSIPAGKVSTYKSVAKYAGAPGAYRAVGTVMRKNPDIKNIPCHRVVGSDGRMHGYAFGEGLSTKIRKLKNEGIVFEGDKISLQRFELKEM